METAKIVISRNDSSNPINARELKSLLSFYDIGYDFDNTIISVGYIREIIKIAIDGLNEISVIEDGLNDLD